jgi:D-sedoheptulose 7-phosphate isomerase
LPDRDRDLLAETLGETIALHERVRGGDLRSVLDAAAAISTSLHAGGKLLVFGNGGSAAEAQHMTCELVGRFLRDRPALAAVALTTDTSALTAIGNDFAFDRVFARQIEALGRPGDVALGISTSGASANVLLALAAAKAHKLRTIAMTGRDGGEIGRAAEIHVNVPSPSTQRVQEVHLTLIHIICDLVERGFAGA